MLLGNYSIVLGLVTRARLDTFSIVPERQNLGDLPKKTRLPDVHQQLPVGIEVLLELRVPAHHLQYLRVLQRQPDSVHLGGEVHDGNATPTFCATGRIRTYTNPL